MAYGAEVTNESGVQLVAATNMLGWEYVRTDTYTQTTTAGNAFRVTLQNAEETWMPVVVPMQFDATHTWRILVDQSGFINPPSNPTFPYTSPVNMYKLVCQSIAWNNSPAASTPTGADLKCKIDWYKYNPSGLTLSGDSGLEITSDTGVVTYSTRARQLIVEAIAVTRLTSPCALGKLVTANAPANGGAYRTGYATIGRNHLVTAASTVSTGLNALGFRGFMLQSVQDPPQWEFGLILGSGTTAFGLAGCQVDHQFLICREATPD